LVSKAVHFQEALSSSLLKKGEAGIRSRQFPAETGV
jgi:hypothetical protein